MFREFPAESVSNVSSISRTFPTHRPIHHIQSTKATPRPHTERTTHASTHAQHPNIPPMRQLRDLRRRRRKHRTTNRLMDYRNLHLRNRATVPALLPQLPSMRTQRVDEPTRQTMGINKKNPHPPVNGEWGSSPIKKALGVGDTQKPGHTQKLIVPFPQYPGKPP